MVPRGETSPWAVPGRRRWYDREPVAIWLPLAAIATGVIQSVAYTGYKFFYDSFGVRPQEVGYDYSSLIPTNAYQLAIILSVALLLLSVGSLVFAMYGVLFKLVFDDLRGPPTNCSDRRTPRVRTMRAFGFRVSWTRTPRARTQSAMSRAWRDLGVLLAPFGAALILGHSAHLTASISAWIGLALCLVVLAINDAHARTIGRPHSSVLASLLEPRAYRGARRLVIIAGAVALGVTYGSAGALTIIGTIVMVYLLDRFLPVVDPVDQSGDVVPGGGTSRWLRAVSILAATGLTVIGFLSALPAIIRASNLDAKVASVRAGHRLTYGKLNPLAFAEPRAEPVRVRWVAQNPPDPFTSGRSRSLTYFGQNSGTAVFLDLHVSPTAIYRLPVSALAIESVSPASRP